MGKNIVICCDGTSNDVVGDSTNVLRLFRSLVRNDQQLAFYDSGVGTVADPTAMTKWGKWMSKNLDSGMGFSVRDNVCQAYKFLCRNYEPDDKIYLFGFSRGAYTVRALAGMIHFLGLAPAELEGLAAMAWAVYANDDESLPFEKRFEAGVRFKKSFVVHTDVKIHFAGVWDTVSAFGWIWNMRTAPYTANNPSITHVRHAVSIDEHRACFRENLFRPKSDDQHETFKQVWFAGCHADVGGGYPEEESGLAKIALEWMYDEAGGQGCVFDPRQIDYFLGKDSNKTKPDIAAETHNSTRGFWHALEWIPRKQWDHGSNPGRLRWFAPNAYRRRRLPEDAELHETVREKITADKNYNPRNVPKP